MSWIRQYLLAGTAAGVMALAATPALAVALTPGSGWHSDSAIAGTTPSLNSPLTFTITQNAYLSVTDAFTPGDVYQISTSALGSVIGTTTTVNLPFLWVNAGGTFDNAWASTTGAGAATFSKISLLLSPGTYSLTLEDIDANFGLPAGFAERLDYLPVPEPLGLAVLGMGLVGLAAARKRRTA